MSGIIETNKPTTLNPFWQRYVLPAIVFLLLLVSILGVARTWTKIGRADGSWDLLPYWYFGHFVRAGINPYLAYAEDMKVPKSLHYLDGTEALSGEEDPQTQYNVPADAAPILLFFAPFSLFHWVQAKYFWFFCNLSMLAALPWLAIRMLPPQLKMSPTLQWLAAASFYATKGTREATAVGQAAIVVFFLMVVTLVLPESYWVLAGLTLGLALGKYSMALPICIYLLLAKRFRILIVAGFVQAFSFVVIAALEDTMPSSSIWEKMIATVKTIWDIIVLHAGYPGIHIAYSLREFPLLAQGLVVIITVVTLVVVLLSRRRGWTMADLLPVNSALVLWILLAVYNRNYDTGMVLLFWVLALSVIATWQVSSRTRVIMVVLYTVSLVVMLLPGDILLTYTTRANTILFKDWVDRTITCVIFAMLVANLWLLPRTPRIAPLPPQ